MPFEPSLDVRWNPVTKTFDYGDGVFGPAPEYRRLDAIRASLQDPDCQGPDPVYSIFMDVGREEHHDELRERMLLFGIVQYAAGQLGKEPVRSQGHVHAISPHSGWSAPELFEIWEGRAIVYAQQRDADVPGICVAVEANPGDLVVVPPGWPHCVINADPNSSMIFAACCDREYGFVYAGVQSHGGLSWFPVLNERNQISWQPNPRYKPSTLNQRQAREYPELELVGSRPIYERYSRAPESLQWVSEPSRYADLWSSFVP